MMDGMMGMHAWGLIIVGLLVAILVVLLVILVRGRRQ